MSYKFNFSHSLYTKTNCLLRTHYYLLQKEMGLLPISSEVMQRGTDLHKMCEQYLKNEEVEAKNDEQYNFFHEKVRPYLEKLDKDKIETVEASFTYTLTDSIQGKGIMDLLYDGRIFDWKFTNKPWDDRKLAGYKENQALLYQWLYAKNLNKAPKDVTYWIFPLEGNFQEFKIPFVKQEITEALKIYRAVCDELEECNQKMYFPPNPSYFNCKYCDFNDICPVSVVPKPNPIPNVPRKTFGKPPGP